MTILLFTGTAYVLIGILMMFAVRCWGMWEPLHMHYDTGDFECMAGPAGDCPQHWVGRKPLPLAGWVAGTALWPIVLLVWVLILVSCALVRVGSIRL